MSSLQPSTVVKGARRMPTRSAPTSSATACAISSANLGECAVTAQHGSIQRQAGRNHVVLIANIECAAMLGHSESVCVHTALHKMISLARHNTTAAKHSSRRSQVASQLSSWLPYPLHSSTPPSGSRPSTHCKPCTTVSAAKS